GRQRLAVVELDPVAEPDRVDGALRARGDLLRQAVELELEVRVVDEERLEAGGEAGLVRPVDDVLAVDDVLVRAVRDAEAEDAAALRLRCRLRARAGEP